MPRATLTLLTPSSNLASLEEEWRALEDQADSSFFLSWSWIGPWLEIVRNQTELYLFRCDDKQGVIGLAIFARQRARNHRFFPADRLSLHQVSGGGLNMNIEYNGLLCRHGRDREVGTHLFQALNQSRLPWSELALTAITREHWQQIQATGQPGYWLVDEQHSPWVRDISGIETLDDLLAPLSRNRRGQIKRSIKSYEQNQGALHCQTARSVSEALQMFDELDTLHTQRWNRDGKAGSFANPNWVRFHRRIIERAFPRGEVQLLKVSAGTQTLGVLYNFLWRSQVYVLQTGFALPASNRDQPGYITHSLAMLENARLGMTVYDLMCGDAHYKTTLCTPAAPLYWVRARRPTPANRLEDSMVRLYRRKGRPQAFAPQ